MEPRDRHPLDEEPMLRELHLRHPDVDVVLLPAEEPPARVQEPDGLRATDVQSARQVALDGENLLDGLLLSQGGPAQRRAHGWTRLAAALHVYEPWCCGALDTGDDERGRIALEQVGDDLLARGFDARPEIDGPARLIATDGFWAVAAHAVQGTVSVEVTGPGLSLSDDDIRSLRAGARG